MLTTDEAIEIIRTISTLPSDKVEEVRDFANYLKERYGAVAAVEYSDAWTEEDLRDLTAASIHHATQTVWAEDDSRAFTR